MNPDFYRPLSWALLLCSPLASSASAPEDGPTTKQTVQEELIVTASRQEAESFTLPYTVEVLDQSHLRQRQSRNLPEALAAIPGVMVQKTANGQGSPFVRGFTGYRTLALIDGVRYNNSVYRDGPNEYFSLIDLYSLERLELLSGPASGLFGSDAIGGALVLHSKSSRYTDQAQGEGYQLGQLQYRFASAEHSHILRSEYEWGQGENWGLRLGYTLKDFGDVRAAEMGLQPHTGYDENGLDLRFDTRLNAQWDLSLLHQQLTQDDVWRTHSTIYAIPFEGTEAGSNLRRLKDQDRQLSLLKLRGENPNRWLDHISLTLSEQHWREDGERTKGSGASIVQGFDSRMHGVDLALASHTASVNWRYGLDYYRDRVDSWRRDYHSDGSLDEIRIQGPIGDDSTYSQWGIYAQADWQLAPQQQLLVSSRYGQTRARVGHFEDPVTAVAASFSDRWSSLVNALHYSYHLNLGPDNNQSTLWLGLSQSFRAPNIGDLSRYGTSRSDETEVAATGLEPESFLTYELGWKWRGSTRHAEATYYYTRIRDFIASTPTDRIVDGLTEVTKQNASTGYIEGVELRIEQRLSAQLRLSANITWLTGELDNAGGEREPYSRIMPPSANFQLQWFPPNFDSEVSLHFTYAGRADKLSAGDQNDLQRIPPGGTPGYRLWHLRSHFKLTPRLRVDLALDNLLDEAYRNHGSGSNEPGRNVKFSLSYDF